MSVAALVVSIIAAIAATAAAVTAGFSARHSKASAAAAAVSASAATRVADVEEDRRRDEVELRAATRVAEERALAAQRRAQVIVEIEGAYPNPYLAVLNWGPATARDIRVEPTATIAGARIPVVDGITQPFSLRAGQLRRFQVFMDMGTAQRFICKVRWFDDDDVPCEDEVDVGL